MSVTHARVTLAAAIETAYEAPRLTVIGRAVDVVLGPPGIGWDGPYGITEPQFEFEPDEDQP
ncbi:MAG: hypothetical protein ACRD26_10680 [Vicinamibacterales bacterium]